MFRGQQNMFDDAVAKATDENLTSENWEYILDVCDKVTAEQSGAKDAVSAMIKRLAHRNANVQLYTLELANSLSQNCGAPIYRELASKSFTDALLRLANDRNTHQQVKAKILEHMEQWTEMFASNADLGIMEQAYMTLKSQNPTLQPPSKPTKQQITDVDRQKEEEELQMALALSIKDKSSGAPANQNSAIAQQAAGAAGASGAGAGAGAAAHGASAASTSESQPATSTAIPSGTTAATVSRVRALYDFQPSEPGELQFRKGDVIAVLESVYKDWWKGSLRGQSGIFPLNYVEKIADPTQEELQREAQMEAEVFAEIKNVEKLLALLSTSNPELNVRENEEITTLYHQTLAIRPKLIELIGKYSKKKDDFTQLNEKFIKARRDYEALLEASMAQPAQPQYGRPPQPQPAFGYPPQGGGPQGYAPPQEPQRYFSPHPPQGQDPQNPAGRFYASEQGGQPGPGQPSQPGQPLPYPSGSHSPDPRGRTPSGTQPAQQSQNTQPTTEAYTAAGPGNYPSQTTYDHPQELGTSAYDSPQQEKPPQNIRHSFHPSMVPGQPPQQQPQQQPQQSTPALEYPQSQQYPPPDSQQQPPPASSANPPYPVPPQQQQQQQLPLHLSPGNHQPPPSHMPPPVPSAAPQQPPYPAPSAPPQPGGYPVYQPPTAHQRSSSPGSAANPTSFYR